MTVSPAAAQAGKAALDETLNALTTEKGVQIEAAAVALGVFAGVACQIAVNLAIRDTGSFHGLSVALVAGANGEEYVYGDAINYPLIESVDSVWALVSGKATQLGSPVPDVNELAAYVAGTVGTDRFGIPRYAPGTDTPAPSGYRSYYRNFDHVFDGQVGPDERYIGFAVALQDLLTMVAGQFDLEPLVRIAMESAIAMAKLSPASGSPV